MFSSQLIRLQCRFRLIVCAALLCASFGDVRALTVQTKPHYGTSRQNISALHTLERSGALRERDRSHFSEPQRAALHAFGGQRSNAEDALRQYQRGLGLPANGRFTPQTSRALQRQLRLFADLDAAASHAPAGAAIAVLQRDRSGSNLWRLTRQDGRVQWFDSISPIAKEFTETSDTQMVYAPSLSEAAREKLFSSLHVGTAKPGQPKVPLVLLAAMPARDTPPARPVAIAEREIHAFGEARVQGSGKRFEVAGNLDNHSVRLITRTMELAQRVRQLFVDFLFQQARSAAGEILMPKLMAAFRAYLNDHGIGLVDVRVSYADLADQSRTRQWVIVPAGLAVA